MGPFYLLTGAWIEVRFVFERDVSGYAMKAACGWSIPGWRRRGWDFEIGCESHTGAVVFTAFVGGASRVRRLSKLEYQIMESLWSGGQLSIREIQESFAPQRLSAYTTVQTTVYRMENKKYCAARKEGWEPSCFRSRNFSRCGATPHSGRSAELFRLRRPAGDGAPD